MAKHKKKKKKTAPGMLIVDEGQELAGDAAAGEALSKDQKPEKTEGLAPVEGATLVAPAPEAPKVRTQRVTIGTTKGPVSTVVKRKPAPVVNMETPKIEPGLGPSKRTITMGSTKGPIQREVTLASRSPR